MSPAINLPTETTQRYLTTPSTAIKHPKNTTEAARLCRRYISPNRQYPVASLSHQSMCDCKQSQVPGREREECHVFIQMFMALKKRKRKKKAVELPPTCPRALGFGGKNADWLEDIFVRERSSRLQTLLTWHGNFVNA